MIACIQATLHKEKNSPSLRPLTQDGISCTGSQREDPPRVKTILGTPLKRGRLRENERRKTKERGGIVRGGEEVGMSYM